ncbi:NIPSNAP family protein [Aquibium sp. LZ166]|uniref:NIPSNAP family protein n=1 Tax=Aquibium pacificus TaxID=3153579 RepID=A0ABV3SKZ5_9HYPH
MKDVPLAPPVRIEEYYELRLYQMHQARMPDFHHLMGTDVPPIFERCGISAPLALWEGHGGPLSPLYAYILPWRNLDRRMEAWKRFYADPEWLAKLAVNYGGEQRVDRSHVFVLRPSPVWSRFRSEPDAGPVGSVHELRLIDVDNFDPMLSHTALAETDLPFMTRKGATVLGVFMTWFGTRMNQAVTITAWPDAEALRSAAIAYQTDDGIRAARDEERRRHGQPLVRGSDVHVLRPTRYGAPLPNLAPRG